MNPKRKIKIVLDPRSDKDASSLLKSIADIFSTDDITIKIDSQTKLEGKKNLQTLELENAAIEFAGKALDEADKNIKSKEGEKKNTGKIGRLKTYIQKLSEEGIKVSITTLIKGAIELLFK